jgi:hypothetical protein
MPDPFETYGELFTGGVQHRFSASSLSDWQKCPRYYYYTWIERWRSNVQSVHLDFGSWFAQSLHQFYTRIAKGAAWEDAERETVRWLLEATEGWNPQADGLSKADLKNRHTLTRTVVWYFEHYRNNDFNIWHLSDGSPALELKFEVDLQDVEASLVGTIDRVVEYQDTLLISDQKTTGSALSSYWFSGFDLDVQMSLYPFCGKVLYTKEISGVLIDGVQVAVESSDFARQPTFRTDGQLEEWYRELLVQIDDIQAANRAYAHGHASLEQAYPRNFAGCSMYGRCVFFDICRRPAQFRENFLKRDFVKKPEVSNAEVK